MNRPGLFSSNRAGLSAGILLLMMGVLWLRAAERATISVEADRPGAEVSPTLWGIFFEDINLSADGGIYPELVRNRSFEDADEPQSWTLEPAEGSVEMSVDTSRPLNPFNRRSVRIQFDGAGALINEGYWGMGLEQGESYRVQLSARSAAGFAGPLAVAFEDPAGTELARGSLNGLTDRWQSFTLDLTPTASQPKARLSIQVRGKGTVWLDQVSALPAKTWKNHGLRPDLCQMLDDLKPAFLRFPGGCWVEGDDLAHMYQWKKTIGDVAHRQPLWNIWNYWATHGLGYHEYLQLSEDLGAEPLFCINVGMSHKEVVPLDQMGPWVQDALDAIEYANGPTNSVWGALRARNGHPASFGLKYLEIGNENGGPAYHERYALMYRAIKARYPEIHLIANEWGGTPTNAPVDIVDEHYYNTPEFFIQQASRYDTYPPSGPKIFVGEYAVTQGCGQGNLRGAIGEAAFMTGLERNADVVIMASYAPLFVNVNHKRWNPDLINFDSTRAYGLPSYYVQKMFSENRGDVILPLTVECPETSANAPGGQIGVGTWRTRAEFKDLKVTRGRDVLWSSDFAAGTNGWKFLGGQWEADQGVLRQNRLEENVRALFPGQSGSEFTYSLKARKLEGDEGFLVLFNVTDESAKSWWNIGGWGNQRHALELGGLIGKEAGGGVETNRWYDLRVEVSGRTVKCFLDNRLVNEGTLPVLKSLYASATRDRKRGDVVLKVVNVSARSQVADLRVAGVRPGSVTASVEVLTSSLATDENSLAEPTKVSPRRSRLELKAPNFEHAFPGNSLTVIRVNAPLP